MLKCLTIGGQACLTNILKKSKSQRKFITLIEKSWKYLKKQEILIKFYIISIKNMTRNIFLPIINQRFFYWIFFTFLSVNDDPAPKEY